MIRLKSQLVVFSVVLGTGSGEIEYAMPSAGAVAKPVVGRLLHQLTARAHVYVYTGAQATSSPDSTSGSKRDARGL